MAVVQARRLRQNMTYAERRLWKVLRNGDLGHWKFRRQHPIGLYVADFACVEASLAIEVDGGQHCENARDLVRTSVLEQQGWHVLRFWNNEVIEKLAGVSEALKLWLDHWSLDAPHHPLPLMGEGRERVRTSRVLPYGSEALSTGGAGHLPAEYPHPGLLPSGEGDVYDSPDISALAEPFK